MSDYKNPRPLPSASASDPCVVYDNSVSFDKLINESQVVTTYKGIEIQSVPSLLEQIEAEANAAVISLGWHQVGLFADGFTYTLQNDIAKDAAGDWYRWNGTLPKIVAAGTLPSSDVNFVKIDYKSHADLSDRNPADGSAHNADDVAKNGGGSVQDFINKTDATISELNDIVTVISSSEISSINKPEISAISESKNSSHWSISPTANGLENTPDKIKMADNRYANRVGVHDMIRNGLVTSKDFGHRCGTITYKKVSQSNSKLLTNFDKYKSETNPDFVAIVRYLDPTNGVQGAGGTSWATAEKRWAEIIAMNPDIVYIKSGFLNNNKRITSFTLNKNMALIGVGGPVIVGGVQSGVWSKEGGYTNLYRMTADVPAAMTSYVIDTKLRKEYGTPLVFTKVLTLAACDATAGTWFQDGIDVVVHTHDSREVIGTAFDIICTTQQTSPAINFAGNYKLYCENLHFWGNAGALAENDGALAIKADGIYPNSVLYNKTCEFNGALGSNGNGLSVRFIGVCISENSSAMLNKRDGFNYHWGEVGPLNQSPHFVEIDCFATGNGLNSSSGNNQGSTSHEYCKGFRINTICTNHQDGGNITDVQSSQVWMTGIVSQGSSLHGMRLSTTGSATVDDAEWWIDGAVVTDNGVITPQYAYGDLTFDGSKTKVHVADVTQDRQMYAGVDIISVDDNFA